MSLVDLDLLVERVRSSGARSYIKEAVDCYKAGAYRSCVVATWIALVYDFVDKFRDLALAGDKAAIALVADFDRVQKERDTSAALKFEREVLSIARHSYELISAQEEIDLQRLYDDRNRFSHPNLNQDFEVLSASAELARTHLRNAVEHVMERLPVQGKAALSEIREAVDSRYFPKKIEDAVVALTGTPLGRAKRSVVKEFFLGCTGSLFLEELASDAFDRRYAAAAACHQMHREIIDEVISEKLSALFDKVTDSGIPYLIVLLARTPEYVRRLSEASKLRLRQYTVLLPESQLTLLSFAADLDFLKAEVKSRMATLKSSQLRDFVQKSPRTPGRLLVDRAIEMYEQAKSWDGSNAIASAIWERMLSSLTTKDAERLVRSAVNGEVKYSFNYPLLVKKLIAADLISMADVRGISSELDLSDVLPLPSEKDQEMEDGGDDPF